MDQARADAERFTRDAITARVDVDTARADASLAEWRARETGRAIGVQIRADADTASAARAGEEVGRTASESAQASTAAGMSGMVALITGAIAAAAPFVGAALVGGVGAGFIGVAALAEKSNQQVRDSYVQLGHDVVTEMRNASDQVVPYLAASGRSLDAEFQSLGPSIQQAMSYAGPDITLLTNGLEHLMSNSMPGMVAAMQASFPVMSGLSALMGSLGTAVGDTMQSMSAHSNDFGTALTSLGPIVQAVLGLATNLVNDLASAWADNSASIDAAISGVGSALSGLASGILPVLSAALGDVTGVIQAATAVIQPLAPLLGFVGAAALGLWGSMKLGNAAMSGILAGFNAVSPAVAEYGNRLVAAVGGSDSAISSFKLLTSTQKEQAVQEAQNTLATARRQAAQAAANATAMEAAAASEASTVTEEQATAARVAATAAADAETAAMEGLAAAQSAVEVSLGPLGLALAAGTALIGLFATSQDHAKQSSDQLKQTTDNLAAAFQASHGAVNQTVIQSLQADAGYKAAAASAAQLGVSQAQLTQAIVAGGPALTSLQNQLQGIVDAHTHVSDSVSKADQELGRTTTTIDSEGRAAQNALGQINSLVTAWHNGQINASQLGQAVQSVSSNLVSGTDYQNAAAASAQLFGLSLQDVTAGYQAMITSGAAASFSVADVSEAFIKSRLAIGQAEQSIVQHFQQADQAVVQAQQGVEQANQSYEQSIQSITDAQHSYVQAQQAVVQAEQGVAAAQHGVVQAQDQLQSAYQGVTSAQNAYIRAQDQEYQAQVAVNQAREQAIQDLIALHLQLADQVESEQSARVNLFDATTAAAALGVTTSNAHAIAAQDVTAANEAQIKAALALIRAQNSLNDTLNTGANLRKQVSAADAAGVDGSTVVINAQRALQSAQDQVTASAQALLQAHQQVTNAEYALQQAQQNLVRSQQAVADAAYNEQKAHQAVTQAQQARQQAAQQLQQAQQTLTQAQDADSRSLDLNSAAGQTNLNMMLALWDNIQKTGMPVQDQYRTMIDDVATSFGISKDKAAEYLKQLHLIDPNFRYSVTAVAAVDTSGLSMLLGNLLGPVQPSTITGGPPLPLAGHADGGPITGPGGPRDDVIPIMASAGEYMQPADTVSYYGVGFMEALRQKRIPRGGDGASLQGFADGGMVGTVGTNIGLAAGGANYMANVNALTVMGMPHPPPLPVYVPPPPPVYSGSAGVSQWDPQILQALAMLGQSPAWLGTVERRMNQESGGNPTVVNKWDSNWFAGTPSVGLMQVIGPTFAANAGPFAGVGPYEYGVSVDPLANIYAGLHYAIGRYGSLDALNRPGGYDNGGPLMPGYTVAYNGTGKPENVRTGEQEDAIATRLDRIEQALSSRPGVTVQQTITGNSWTAEDMAAASARHMTAALRELT